MKACSATQKKAPGFSPQSLLLASYAKKKKSFRLLGVNRQKLSNKKFLDFISNRQKYI